MSLPPPSSEFDSEFSSTDEFQGVFGESLSDALNIDTWRLGDDLAAQYERMREEVEEAEVQARRTRNQIREVVFPRIRSLRDVPAAGLYRASVNQVEYIHNNRLFNGKVVACDGTSVVHDTLLLTIAQIGVCLVSYHGTQGEYVHQFYQRDFRAKGLDAVEEALELLERSQKRAAFEQDSPSDKMSNLARRGIMTWAERSLLLHRTEAPWRMGHGNPVPYELITGSGVPDAELLARSLPILEELILKHQQFVFVSSAPSRLLLRLGDALGPLEYLVVDTMTDTLDRTIKNGNYTGAWRQYYQPLLDFAAEAGSKIVRGVYRASAIAPPQVFYAHVDHIHEAALIAISDSAVQDHRGFPRLIDLADNLCRASFGANSFDASVQTAYAEAAEPYRYFPERQTRS